MMTQLTPVKDSNVTENVVDFKMTSLYIQVGFKSKLKLMGKKEKKKEQKMILKKREK